MTTLPLKDLAVIQNSGLEIPERALAVCTCTRDVSANWLINLVASQVSEQSGRKVLLVSFIDSSAAHLRGLKRLGFDAATDPSKFEILNLSSKLFDTSLQPTSVNILTKHILAKLGDKSTVILECPDFLLASGQNEWSHVAEMVTAVRQAAHSVYLFCNADMTLISGETPLSQSQYQFLVQLTYTASVVLSLRSLDTGRAEDVTGVLRIARGPKAKADLNILESEYLYLVQDNTVKLFYR